LNLLLGLMQTYLVKVLILALLCPLTMMWKLRRLLVAELVL